MDSFMECLREVAEPSPKRSPDLHSEQRVCVWHLSRTDRIPKINILQRRKFFFFWLTVSERSPNGSLVITSRCGESAHHSGNNDVPHQSRGWEMGWGGVEEACISRHVLPLGTVG